jgi:O-antigen ligase
MSGAFAGLVAGGVVSPKLAILAICGFFATVVVARDITWGMAAVVFMIYINLSDVLIQHHGLPSIAKTFVPAMILLILLEWLRTGRRISLPREGLLLLGLYTLAILLSFFYAPDQARVTDGFFDLIKNLMIAIALALLVRSPQQLRIALWSIIAGAFVLTTINSYKYVTGNFSSEFGGFAQSGVSFMADDNKMFRLSGVLAGPNFFAQLLLIAVPISFERLLSESSRWLKIIAGTTLLLSVFVILLTFSRGALLALLCMGVVLLFKLRRNPGWLLAGLLFVIASLPLLPAGYVDRLSSALPHIGVSSQSTQQPDVSVRGRLGEMRVAWELFLDHPLLGVGYNNYENYFQQYTLNLDQMPRGEARPAHSLYLEIAAEGGLVGIGAFALLLVYFARIVARGYTLFSRSGRSSHANMIAGLAMGLVGYLIAAVFLHDAYPRYFWLLAGLILSLPGMMGDPPGNGQMDTARDDNELP